jgi:rRNA maturation protein Nop10
MSSPPRGSATDRYARHRMILSPEEAFAHRARDQAG